jgi:hypothetical protein
MTVIARNRKGELIYQVTFKEQVEIKANCVYCGKRKLVEFDRCFSLQIQ